MDNLAVIPQSMPTETVISYFLGTQTVGTAITYGSHLRSFFSWANKDYRTIGPFDALNYDAHIKLTLAEATVQTKIATLKMFFGFAKDVGLIDKNPFALIKQKSSPSRVAEKFLTNSQVDKFLTAMKEAGKRQYVLGILLASTGARISEIQQLSWKDFVEMPDGTVSVNLKRKGNEYQLLSLRDDVFKVVKEFIGKELNQLDDSPILLNPSKQRISVVSLRAWVESAASKAGITKKVTPHTFRHSFCSNALAAGADLRDVQQYLNHKSVQTTMVYMHGQNQKVGEFLNLKVK